MIRANPITIPALAALCIFLPAAKTVKAQTLDVPRGTALPAPTAPAAQAGIPSPQQPRAEEVALTIPDGRVQEGDLSVTKRRVELHGTLKGNLLAVDSPVNLYRGSLVTGDVVRVGDSTLKKEAGARVQGRILRFGEPSDMPGTYVMGIAAAPQAGFLHHPPPRQGDPVGAQVFVVLVGLLSALLALVVAPRASAMAVAAIESEPARCLAVGAVAFIALGLANVVNGVLFSTVVWIPVGVLVIATSSILAIYGGLLGVAFIGGHIARRLGKRAPGFFWRAAIGLVTLGVLNCIPGINAISGLLELLAFILGLGALVVTGLGRDPQWLTDRLSHGSSPGFDMD